MTEKTRQEKGCRRRSVIGIFCLSFILGMSALTALSPAQSVTFFRIGTGSTSGTYFPIGTLIGTTITGPPGSRSCEDGGSCGVPGLIAAAQTTRGSVANIKGVLSGNLETGLAQSDIVHAAAKGQGVFKGNKQAQKDLRVIANLYPENVHLVVRKAANIKTVADLKGKRISIDLSGSGTRENAKAILSAYKIGEKDYIPVTANPDKSIRFLQENKLDAFFFVAGYPAIAVAELASNGLVDLLPITGKEAQDLIQAHPFFSTSNIPAGTYVGIGEVETLAVSTQWIVSAKMDDDLVYAITRALWHPRNRVLLDGGHAKGRLIRLETALEGVGNLLHSGARKFYMEIRSEEDG
ncbi:TAXI family TRAP transporter solute-binding subunit [Sneathiella aquimaris]|uniref:TAXI family TRAP transporter solute-binding subunit n=1 Tax=Sneathiella aquimaris TaxID=2599305 RepID=UPI00146C897B|nr:TAXI family TRAP transporter solute-binding subunit [Sneathiella aquimaris]